MAKAPVSELSAMGSDPARALLSDRAALLALILWTGLLGCGQGANAQSTGAQNNGSQNTGTQTDQNNLTGQQASPQQGATDVVPPAPGVEVSTDAQTVELSSEAADVKVREQRSGVEVRNAPDTEVRYTPQPGQDLPELPAGAVRAAQPIYSAGRRAEPALWALLNAGRYDELQRDIARLRNEDPNWQPPTELLFWLDHHLAEQAKPSAPAVAGEPAAPARPDPYAEALTRAGRQQSRGQPGAALNTLKPWLKTMQARRDASAMAQVGWARLALDQPQQALAAFQQALRWRGSSEAAKGELLALSALGEPDPLLAQAETSTQRWPALRKSAAGALRALAVREHQQGDYQAAGRLLSAAQELSPADRDTQMLTGWNDFKLGDYRRATDTFQALYQAEPDKPSAEGLLQSLEKLGDRGELRALAQAPGPLRDLWRREQAQTRFDQSQFLRAYRLDPSLNPALENIESPALALGLGWRSRSGDPGLSRLDERTEPLLLASGWLGEVGLSLAVERISLDAGKPDADALLGSWPSRSAQQQSLGQFSEWQAARRDNQVEGGLSWMLSLNDQRLQLGDWQLVAAIGQTPTEGALPAGWQGLLGVERRQSNFAWTATFEHLPLRESLLSYTGMVDPVTGNAWGRVSRTGVSLDGWMLLNPDWTLSGLLRAHAYRGTDVEDNFGIEAGLSLGRNLNHPDFAYLTLGPALEYRHFERNLNHFTWGHGGYYSPDLDLGVMLALDFQTREAAHWLVRGSARAGWRMQNEAESPWYPLGLPQNGLSAGLLDPGINGTYADSRKQGLGGSLRLEGVMRLSSYWQLGGTLSADYSPQFDEFSGMLFVRRLFSPRPAVFSSDLLSESISP
ncbi:MULTISPECIES: cellulose synthase subunit BcsC-related outer membrane protein [Thiorhodovibrio]|uniref:cellulose synthase subunit BcsC-related outer membrane protein n=1 Tax=Thiorhodovibrio TaxID=61593 RepID=UPI001911CF12|nr:MULTISPECIES: cellulose synthase subunit BcsC-related outer membrane protein [Thiorhodovibrio]